MTVQPVATQQTLAQLFSMLIKSMLKGLLKRIPFAIGLSFFTMILHTYLLVVTNEGFNAGESPFLDSILALRGRMISGTLFWALLAGLSATFFARFRQVGISGTMRGLRAAPAWVRSAFQQNQVSGLGILLAGAGLTLLLGTWLNNRLVSLQLCLVGIGALIAQHESFGYMLLNASWGDTRRLLKRDPKPFNPAWAGAIIAGMVLGFGGATILLFSRFLGCAGSLILIGVALALILMQQNKSTTGIAILVLGTLLSLALATTPVLADDGGWVESGGTFSAWISSTGAILAVAHGVPPSLGTLIGILAGGSVVGLPGTVPVPQPQVHVPPPADLPQQPPPYDAPPVEPVDDGWPKIGEVNEQGQVWYHPPWDQGGAYWVDRDEYDDIQENLANGYVWSDRWGWKPPEEINQLDTERDKRWQKFTDPAEGQKRHDQMMKQIDQDLANDPHHQKLMAELDAIKNRLDNMKKQMLLDDIEYHQKIAKIYEKKADLYDKLHTGASVVKTGADFAIDTLGMAPGAGRVVKYGYKFVSNTAETSIETGSISQGLTKGVAETTKAYVGDKIGNVLPTPGIHDPTVWSKIPAKYFVKKVTTSPYDAGQLLLNKLKDSSISEGVNRFESDVKNIMGIPEK
jgi:hypothetical protein